MWARNQQLGSPTSRRRACSASTPSSPKRPRNPDHLRLQQRWRQRDGRSPGLAGGTTTFYGESGSYTLSGLQPQSQVIAGTGTETYTTTASGVIFTSGAASDTFNVTGNGNTFQAKEGPDAFYDNVLGAGPPSNIVDFSDVGTSSELPLSVNASGRSPAGHRQRDAVQPASDPRQR